MNCGGNFPVRRRHRGPPSRILISLTDSRPLLFPLHTRPISSKTVVDVISMEGIAEPDALSALDVPGAAEEAPDAEPLGPRSPLAKTRRSAATAITAAIASLPSPLVRRCV
jgi:hypothetical protein